MEEIDIIELLKRVKEGKAPKKIEIDSTIYTWNNSNEDEDIENMYIHFATQHTDFWLSYNTIRIDTKIKILDKPIIEELDYSLEELENTSYNESWLMNCIRANKKKINEIIKWINEKN